MYVCGSRLGYVERKTEEYVVLRARNNEVGGHRQLGSPKLRWGIVVRKDMKEKHVNIWKKCKNGERGNWNLDAPTPSRNNAEEEEDVEEGGRNSL